jgi:hypothetical protein
MERGFFNTPFLMAVATGFLTDSGLSPLIHRE